MIGANILYLSKKVKKSVYFGTRDRIGTGFATICVSRDENLHVVALCLWKSSRWI